MRNPNVGTSDLVARQMAELLGPRKHVIDLGAGSGTLIQAYRTRWGSGARMVAIELDRERLPITPDQGIEWRVGDALRLTEEGAYDGILANPPYRRNTHLSQEERRWLRANFESAWGQFDEWFVFVDKAVRLLAPGGRAVLLIPSGLESRPAAARLRALLDRAGAWRCVGTTASPYSVDVSVHAEILCIDRTGETTTSELTRQTSSDAVVSVGAATGANSVFIREPGDGALVGVEQRFVVPVVRGRDVAAGRSAFACSPLRAVLPYERCSEKLVPADLQRFPGLSKFLDCHSSILTRRSRGGVDRYIQCPPAAINGWRIVVPEVFEEPSFALVPDGTLVLNSAFSFSVPPNVAPAEILNTLRACAGYHLRKHARPLSDSYLRITATGLKAAIAEALDG